MELRICPSYNRVRGVIRANERGELSFRGRLAIHPLSAIVRFLVQNSVTFSVIHLTLKPH